ncbi:MAG: XkdX family protein [Clostridia bacterium]|nr:XkdX family protein [Clostridia bacterium]
MFDGLKTRFEKNFVRKDQLQKYVAFGKITTEEYQEITGEVLPV